VTADHYLVVGVLEPPGLLVFDLHAGGPPTQLLWPKQVEFVPFDMAPRPRGGVWILDRKNARYWALDRHLRVLTRDQALAEVKPREPDLFQPVGEDVQHCSAALHFPEGISLNDASPIASADPIAIEALVDEKVLILDANPGQQFSQVLCFEFGTQIGDPALPDEMASLLETSAQSFALHAYDFAFVAQSHSDDPQKLGQLTFVTADGNQAFAFDLRFDGTQVQLKPRQEYYPMRLFSGMALVAADGGLYYDSNRRWLPLRAQIRPRYDLGATLSTPVFDGREPQCVWHRLFLDGCLPPDASVEISSRAADEKGELATRAWQQEPALHRRDDGSELPFVPAPTTENHGTFELLFQKAKGRYLQLRLQLAGNGRVSPRLHALRAYYPRFSYLNHYLPAVYLEEPEPASFLDRFLANLEGFNTVLEDRIVAARMLFDVRSAPADVLEWLASWFGVALDPAWDEQRQRLFIRHAMDFFQWRGTPHGLQMALRLAFDEKPTDAIFAPPGSSCSGSSRSGKRTKQRCRCSGVERYRIVERFRTRRRPGVIFGDPTAVSGPRQTLSSGRWLPEKGLADLNRRYQEAIGKTGETFSLDVPTNAAEAAARAAFAQAQLGFLPSDNADDLLGWRNFLRSRYSGDISGLNKLPGVSWSSFEDITLPSGQNDPDGLWPDWKAYLRVSPMPTYAFKRRMWQEFLTRRYNSVNVLNSASVHASDWPSLNATGYPTELRDGALLHDWFQFESVVLPTLEAAHQFTVLLPSTGETATDTQRRREQLRLAERIVELEKPAHTTFAVKFYWALFRLGEARLGQDSLLGLGGRDPALLPAAVLGQTYLAESRLTPGHPFDVKERQVVGRDPVVSRTKSSELRHRDAGNRNRGE
jgi:phage tail-like protein